VAALVALDRLLEAGPDAYAAAIFEPLVQGAGGMRMCRPAFMQALAARLNAADVPLILDEVMTGFGRTGAMFACEKAGIVPDIVCLSKGITGGFLPLAATVATERIYAACLSDDWARAFNHGHSYTANPLACAAGLASLDLFEDDKTLSRIAKIEGLYRERVAALAKKPNIARARVLGDIAAFEVEAGDAGYGSAVGSRLKEIFLAEGMLLRPLGNTVYLIPPYCITDAELHRAFDVIETALDRVA
jgi:adenosylmethionine-8-amino-7-oxononanoate aminotransferase